MPTLVITDASVLLNLLASGAAEEIFGQSGLDFAVCPSVVNEARLLRDRETGDEYPVDLEPLFKSNALRLVSPETDEEWELLVEYTATLGRGSDGEAMCFALAESRSYEVATDDDRAIKRASRRFGSFKTLGTIEILMRWQQRNAISPERMSTLTGAISRLARYRPGPSHPSFAWWENPQT